MMGGLSIWLTFVFCLALSFILSGMEAGVFALSRLRIRQQSRAGQRSAQVLHGYLRNPERFLWTILVGNTVANLFILGWLVMVLYVALHGSLLWFVLVYGFLFFLFYSLFDFLPKMLFRSYPNRLCLAMARPFRALEWVLRPLVAAVEWSSDWLLRVRGGKAFTGYLFGNREELRLVMQESAQGFSSEERAIINRVLDLQSLTVRQVMKPLDQAVTVDTRTTIGEALGRCREARLTRLPVWETGSGQSRIAGIFDLNQLLYLAEPEPSRLVGEQVKPALYLDEGMHLEDAMRRMQRSGHRLAIVLARDRHETGILSLQDILKVIFGEVGL